MLDEIFVARLHAGAARASAALHAVGGDRRALHVAGVADRDRCLLVRDEVFEHDLGSFIFDPGAAFITVELLNLFQFLDDHAAQFPLGAQNRFVFRNVVAHLLQLVRDFVDGKLGQAMQLQFQNGIGLLRAEGLLGINLRRAPCRIDFDFLAAEVCDKVFAGVAAIGAAANDDDDIVQMVERREITFENVLAVAGLREQIGSAAADYVDTVVDEVFDGLDQAQFARLSVHHGQENHAETFLHGGVLEELVENDLRLGAALQLDDDAHAVAIAFVADVRNVFDVFVVDQLRDALDQPGLVHLIRNFGDDDGLLVLRNVFDGSLGAHHEAAAPGAVGFENSGTPVDDAGSGEVWSLHVLQNFRELRAGIVDERDGGVHNFRQIVRRNLGSHSDRDSVGAVDQQIGDARGKNIGFAFAAVVVGMEVDRVLVEIFEESGCNLRELGFGVPIRRWRISIDRSKISLPKDQRIPHAPGLSQPHQRVIDGQISVRMVLAHHLSDDPGAFPRSPIRLQPHLLHREKYAAVHGLESVTYVGQRAADDHRHRVVEIRTAH